MSAPITASIQNLEEAVGVASEFISSLDNLPNEVQHLLQEIRLKEFRCQGQFTFHFLLQQEIAKDQSRYIKHSLKSIPAPSPSSKNSDVTPAPTLIGNGPKPHLPGRISAAYAEIDKLSEQKMTLAQRIIELISRTRARLDSDLTRVRVLQGESPDEALVQIGDSLRNAMAGATSADSGVLSLTPSLGAAYKKRRITTTTSIKLPSPAPAPSVKTTSSTTSRSRLSRQVQPKKQIIQEDIDADAEGGEDIEGDEGEDDTTPYCFCQRQSYGDMIGCDNPDCPYQWFHISCVGVKQPLPDKWYCPECKAKGAVPERRKGRKK
ncbi:hypothetical protein BDQ12DRAFT_702837 [Crucibulum laeve]|uniref:Chromatin modification-related protein n=1 Tax=Crucibulum laeve TaxID=68775 RepID=A0A5C3MG06_9AGAR|nr:hypothetical protein BDQ12DRAFT_702837 [Crucibulum laeve]